jgi:hypothetical protein
MDEKFKKRSEQLIALGLVDNGRSYVYDVGVISVRVNYPDVLSFSEEKWSKSITDIKMAIK